MDQALCTFLHRSSYETTLPDGSLCRTIGTATIYRLAEQHARSGREVEIVALRQDIVPDRYLRNLKTLTLIDLIKLLESTVCVIGLGGLGGLVAETLARMGIGKLHLVDNDRFEAHNLNRQLFSDTKNVGGSKAEAAGKRLKGINPGLEVRTTQTYLNRDTADELIRSCDLVVDCLDNIPSRFALAAAARHAGIPMVSAAVAGLSGHITTVFPNDNGLEAIFGPEDALTITKGAETKLGCLAPAVNLVASLESAEVLKVLLKSADTLSNRVLLVDLTDYTFEILQLS